MTPAAKRIGGPEPGNDDAIAQHDLPLLDHGRLGELQMWAWREAQAWGITQLLEREAHIAIVDKVEVRRRVVLVDTVGGARS